MVKFVLSVGYTQVATRNSFCVRAIAPKTFTRGAYCYYLSLLSSERRQCVVFENGCTFHDGAECSCPSLIRVYYVRAECTCCNYTAPLYTCSVSTTLTLKTGPRVFDDNSKVGVSLSPHTPRRKRRVGKNWSQPPPPNASCKHDQGQIPPHAAAAPSFCPYVFDPRLIRIQFIYGVYMYRHTKKTTHLSHATDLRFNNIILYHPCTFIETYKRNTDKNKIEILYESL